MDREYLNIEDIHKNLRYSKVIFMCDADLDYLGREDFYEISDSLKNELIKFGKISGDRQWDQMQISFLEKHPKKRFLYAITGGFYLGELFVFI
jgi:hypothetical protein